jgi:hypothetical protein
MGNHSYTLPPEIRHFYLGAEEVVGSACNNTATTFHVWTYHGRHDRWVKTAHGWVKTDSQQG